MILRLYVKLWYNVVIVWRETVTHDERSSSSSSRDSVAGFLATMSF